jgi:hypothetical protein
MRTLIGVMRIPPSASIPVEKITDYLLRPRQIDDKSRFLARGGFSASDWKTVEAAIRDLAETTTANQDGTNEYGTFWRTEGFLVGPQAKLPVVLIWLEWAADGSFHFVTLKPLKRNT